MSEKIRVLYIEPGKKAMEMHISNTLRKLQELVEGYIEIVTISSGVCFICNDEARLNGMKFNFKMCGNDFFGPVIIAGTSGSNLADLPDIDNMIELLGLVR